MSQPSPVVAPAPARAKPLLRGVSHQVSFFLALPLMAWLAYRAPDAAGAVYAGIYGASLVALLGISALYHRKHWEPRARARMRSLDHATIFLLIAGTYTPITLRGVDGERGAWMCAIIWAGALVGIAQTLLWEHAPRALHVGIYVVIGWVGAAGLLEMRANIGTTGLVVFVVGGSIYTLGAVTYARKRPDPLPAVFGYHEVFHALVLVACACMFDVVRRCLRIPLG